MPISQISDYIIENAETAIAQKLWQLPDLAQTLSQITHTHEPLLRAITPEQFAKFIGERRVLIAHTLGHPAIHGMLRYEDRGTDFVEIGGIYGPGLGRPLLTHALQNLVPPSTTPLLVTRRVNHKMLHLAAAFGFTEISSASLPDLQIEMRKAFAKCLYKDSCADDGTRVVYALIQKASPSSSQLKR